MHREPNYYIQLERQIEIQTQERDELLEIAKQEFLWQALDFDKYGRMMGDDVASRYRDAATHLTKVIDGYKEQLPCYEFIQRFGFWLHEEYHERYPINVQTRLQIVPYDGHCVRYAILQQPKQLMSIYDIDISPTVPPSVALDIREALWERWRDIRAESPIVALAYNDFENIVYVGA